MNAAPLALNRYLRIAPKAFASQKTKRLQRRLDCEISKSATEIIQDIARQERLLARAILENCYFGGTTAEPRADAGRVVKR